MRRLLLFLTSLALGIPASSLNAEPQRSSPILAGTFWTHETGARIMFWAERYVVYGFCHQVTGIYVELERTKIKMHTNGSMQAYACRPPSIMDAQDRLFDALHAARSFHFQSEQLDLLDLNGAVLLTLQRAP
jgi:heat shock protein HslJ